VASNGSGFGEGYNGNAGINGSNLLELGEQNA